MTMTDPIADMLTRIRNANSAQFDTVKMPGSKLKEALAAILEKEGYIAGYAVSTSPGPARVHARDHDEVRARPDPDHRRASSGSPSRACGSTPRPTASPGCSAGWGWPSSPPATG